jgi:hypothetical protein
MDGSQTTWSISPNVRSILDDESGILLDLRNGRFCGLNQTGVRIWKILQQDKASAVKDVILDSLEKEFDVPARSLEIDLDLFLHNMLNQGLLQNRDCLDAESMNASVLRFSSSCLPSDEHDEKRSAFDSTPCQGSRVFHLAGTTVAFVSLMAAKFLLKVGGFRSLHSVVKKWPIRSQVRKITVSDVCLIVGKGARFCPKRAWCLERAAITVCILRFCGLPAQFVIGCRKLPFASHAWVEISDNPINESSDVRSLYKIIERC